MVSIKCPTLLNDLVWTFLKGLYQTTRSIPEKIDRIVLFQGYHGQFLVSKRPGPGIWKKSLLNDQYYIFSNSRSIEWPGFMIETLEYVGSDVISPSLILRLQVFSLSLSLSLGLSLDLNFNLNLSMKHLKILLVFLVQCSTTFCLAFYVG